MTDEQIIQQIRQGEQSALAALYDRYGTAVYSLAYRVLQNAQLAEEATQDTFMKVWHGHAHWDAQKGRFMSWLLTIARNTSIDLLRVEQRRFAVSLDHVAEPKADMPDMQDKALLRDLMHQLPDEQAHLINLAFFRGMTHSELAEKLDLPLGTVKTRVRLGLQKLKALWIEATREH